MLLLLMLSAVCVVVSSTPAPAPIIFIINSQPGEFHQSVAVKTRRSIVDQWSRLVSPDTMTSVRVQLSSDMDKEVLY